MIEQKVNQYREFWQNNLQAIEEISKRIEGQLYDLEKRYSDFDSVYHEITKDLKILSSIYSNFNNLKGREDILKLRAVLKSYKDRYTREGINFEVIYNFQSRINDLIKTSFKQFPTMDHSSNVPVEPVNEPLNTHETYSIKDPEYKWATFYWNGSWFISYYDSVYVKNANNAEGVVDAKSGVIQINGRKLNVTNTFLELLTMENEVPGFYVVIELGKNTRCYAAHKLGRKIFAEKDVLKRRVEPFKNSNIYPGRIRIFGKNHILLS